MKQPTQSGRSAKPLAGKRILVGRAQAQAGALSDLLRKAGASPIEVPFIEIVPPRSFAKLDRALRDIESYDWLILTSVNGVDVFFARARKLRVTLPSKIKIAAIGPATRDAIQDNGPRVHGMPKEYVAESVVALLQDKVQGKRVLLCRAAVARDVIPTELRKRGAEVDVVEAYRTVLPRSSRAKLKAIFASARRRPEAVAFTSSSTVKNFFQLAGKAVATSSLVFASIGPVTSATLRGYGVRPQVEAKMFTMAGVVEALKSHFQKEKTGQAPSRRKRALQT